MRRNSLGAALFWLLFLGLAPLLLWQGRRTRRNTLRLPEAIGPQQGSCGSGPPLKLHLIGESPVAGVGVAMQSEGIGPALAMPLSSQLQRQVYWHCHGHNGATLQQLLGKLPTLTTPPDAVIIMVGVNDTTQLTSLVQWRQQLQQLKAVLGNTTLFFTPVPPMAQFSALPKPLNLWLGLRAHLLNAEVALFCSQQTRCHYLSYGKQPLSAQLLAADGFHPSAAGYKAMGEQLSASLAQHFKQV